MRARGYRPRRGKTKSDYYALQFRAPTAEELTQMSAAREAVSAAWENRDEAMMDRATAMMTRILRQRRLT